MTVFQLMNSSIKTLFEEGPGIHCEPHLSIFQQACSTRAIRMVMLLLPSLPHNVVSFCGGFCKTWLMCNRFTRQIQTRNCKNVLYNDRFAVLSEQPSKTMTFLCFVFSPVLYFFKKKTECMFILIFEITSG